MEADENTCRLSQLFSWATGADENKAPYFRRPPGPTKLPRRAPIFVGLGEADENSCTFSSNIFSAAIFVGLCIFSWVFCYKNLCVSCSERDTKVGERH